MESQKKRLRLWKAEWLKASKSFLAQGLAEFEFIWHSFIF
jgi:hypothetical protein